MIITTIIILFLHHHYLLPEFPRQNFPTPSTQPPNLSDFFLDNFKLPPLPVPPSMPPQPKNLTFKNGIGTNTKLILSGDCLIRELARVIEKKELKQNLVPDNYIVFSLPKLQTILDNEDFDEIDL